MTIAVVVLVLFVGVAGLLRAASVSMMRIPRADALRAAAEGTRGAARAAELLEERDAIVPAVNVAHLTLVVVAAVTATWLIVRSSTGLPVAVALAAVAAVVLLVADLIPRAVGRRRSLQLAYRLVGIVAAAVAVGAFATEFVVDEEDDEPEDDPLEDLRERALIGAVIEFRETVVREVMVPRPDMVSAAETSSVGEALTVFERHGFSRLPVTGSGLEDVVGLLILKDLLPALAGGRHGDPIGRYLRPVQFVPETQAAADLLRTMQTSKSHLAVAVDEFGAVAGLVTIEDLLEELVGEIADEYDEDERMVVERPDGSLLVDGRLSVAELSGIVGADLPDDEWDTVAGLVLDLAGRVPEERERFEAGPVSLTVARVQGRRVGAVVVERRPPIADQP